VASWVKKLAEQQVAISQQFSDNPKLGAGQLSPATTPLLQIRTVTAFIKLVLRV